MINKYFLFISLLILSTQQVYAADSTQVTRFALTPYHKGYVLTRGTDTKRCDSGPCHSNINTNQTCLSTHRPEVMVAPLSSVYNRGRPIRRYVIKNPYIEQRGSIYLIHFDKVYADEYSGVGNEFLTFNYTVLCV